MSFALFFLAEYCHIILMSALGVILFWGLALKSLEMCWFVEWYLE